MIVSSHDFINRLERIGCDKNVVLFLANRFLSDQVSEIKETVINFPNEKTVLKDYDIYFRFDYNEGNLTIYVTKPEDEVEDDVNFIFTNFYDAVKTLAH